MTDSTDRIAPPERGSWWRNRRKLNRIGLLVGVGVLAAGVAWGITEVVRSCGSPWSGVDKVDGECVGVTDGSYVFRPELADVQRLIAAENARVRDEASSYVTVAVLDPLSPASQHVLPAGAVRQRLEGAYTALRRVNGTTFVGDSEPQIRLVLASEGSTEPQLRHVTDRLVEMSDREENPLVAVVGLGVSTQQTQERAERLSEEGIPMVSAYLTADELDYENIPGLIRMSPSNRQYVDALRDYVNTTNLESGIMVSDSNSEGGVDLFTKTLADNFDLQMEKLKDFPTQPYTGTGVATEGVQPQLFATTRANICAAAPNGLQAVLYAGREIDLPAFLDSLGERPCPDAELTILTAGLDLGEILDGREQDLRDSNLTVVFAGTVDAEGWRLNVEGTPEHYRDFLSVFVGQRPDVMQQGFDPGQLDGANGIMMHDALLAATGAVRLAAPQEGESRTAGGVNARLLSLNGVSAVRGASGTLSFSPDRPRGYPVGKPIPVLQYPQPSNSPSRQVGPLYEVPG